MSEAGREGGKISLPTTDYPLLSLCRLNAQSDYTAAAGSVTVIREADVFYSSNHHPAQYNKKTSGQAWWFTPVILAL